MQVRVHCVALGGVDLTSAAGKMTMAVIAAVAEFERDLLVERIRPVCRARKRKARDWGAPGGCRRSSKKQFVADAQMGLPAESWLRNLGLAAL